MNTTTEEIQQQVEEIKGKVHLNAKTVFCSINKFASVKGNERYVSWSSCKRKISFTANKKPSVQCTHCKAVDNISWLMKSLHVKIELQFNYKNEQIWCTVFKDTFLNIIDFEKLNNDKIGEKVLQLGNNDIGFNNTAKIITSLSCRRNEW